MSLQNQLVNDDGMDMSFELMRITLVKLICISESIVNDQNNDDLTH